MNRTSIAMVTLAVLAGGCTDLGLDGNVPAEQSRTAPPPELVAEVMAPTDHVEVPLVVDGRLWVPTGMPTVRAAAELRPVGSTAGRTVYARAWDDRPFAAIFTRVQVPAADAAATAQAAMLAERDHWQEYAPATGSSGRSAPTGRFRGEPTEAPAQDQATGTAPTPDQPTDAPAPSPDEPTAVPPTPPDQ